MTIMRSIGVLAHPLRPYTFPLAESIAESLRQHDIATWVYTDWEESDVEDAVRQTQMIVAIGGDGAMLRAARVSARHRVPVLGINMGQLGFLTEINGMGDWEHALKRLIDDDFWIEKRMMIRAQHIRDGEVLLYSDALNDIVISANVFGKMIHLDCHIDADWATTYSADALVVSSATGSTAYALSLGGPILPPNLNNILIVPAAPHLSMERPIVLAEGSQVEITPTSRNRNKIVLTADGTQLGNVVFGDVIRVQASEFVSSFVRLRGRNYFYRSLLDRLEPRYQRTYAEQHTIANTNQKVQTTTMFEDHNDKTGSETKSSSANSD